MCGYLGNQTDSPLVRLLLHYLGMEDALPRLRDNPGSGPAAGVDIILEDDSGRRPQAAIWWLLLEWREAGGYRPSRYTSFNTRSDKLDEKRSAGYRPYRQARCIVPASYFIEGDGPKGRRHYHRMEPDEHAFALGGLYRTWVNKSTGEMLYSCSVITLPPHPSETWRQVHGKSTPLMLPTDRPEVIDRWLDPGFASVEDFSALLQPTFTQGVSCVPIQRPGDQKVLGDALRIDKPN